MNTDTITREALRASLGIVDESVISNNSDGLDAKLASDRTIDRLMSDITSDCVLTLSDARAQINAVVPDGATWSLDDQCFRCTSGSLEARLYVSVNLDPRNERYLPHSRFVETPAQAVAFVTQVLAASRAEIEAGGVA
nr:hypothetical protein WG33_0213 [uncultured bacterium]